MLCFGIAPAAAAAAAAVTPPPPIPISPIAPSSPSAASDLRAADSRLKVDLAELVCDFNVVLPLLSPTLLLNIYERQFCQKVFGSRIFDPQAQFRFMSKGNRASHPPPPPFHLGRPPGAACRSAAPGPPGMILWCIVKAKLHHLPSVTTACGRHAKGGAMRVATFLSRPYA